MIMTVPEVAEYLRVHPITVYRLAREGKIPGFKIGFDWRFNSETLERWIKQKGERRSSARKQVLIGPPF